LRLQAQIRPTTPSLSKLTAVVTFISTPLFAAPQITEFVAINANSQTGGLDNGPTFRRFEKLEHHFYRHFESGTDA
jgi:hypothetical protein